GNDRPRNGIDHSIVEGGSTHLALRIEFYILLYPDVRVWRGYPLGSILRTAGGSPALVAVSRQQVGKAPQKSNPRP
ncbi:MAG: hypothetical protein PX638_11335, partial [Microcystis sp. M53599_WE4]|nr:hypothetical protein [Microcystis sp. M53599_WE4]